MDANSWTALFTGLAALASVAAAWGSRASALATRRAAEAALIASFLDVYFNPKMADALRTLREWKDAHQLDFVGEFRSGVSRGDPKAQQVDQSRRYVKSYFRKIVSLIQTNMISEPAAQVMGRVAALELYYEIIDPLELAIDPDRDPFIVQTLMSKFGRYSSKRILPIRASLGATD
jgi:hypothetical protein